MLTSAAPRLARDEAPGAAPRAQLLIYANTDLRNPLRVQGEAYAARLAAAGVATVVRREPGMVHNFLLWDLVSPACAAAADRVADDLATQLAAEATARQAPQT